jgi:hypothetical protein
VVQANPPGHLPDVRPHLLGQAGQLVDEADLQGQEGVGPVLDELRRSQVRGEEGHRPHALGPGEEGGRGKALLQDGLIELPQHLNGPPVLRPHHDPVRIKAVVKGLTLPQELGVGGHGQAAIGLASMGLLEGSAHQGLHVVAATHGHRGLVHHHGEALSQVPTDSLGGRAHLGEVRGSVGKRRGAHGDEDHLCLRDRLLVPGGEAEPLPHQGQHLLGMWLVERKLSPVQPGHLVRIQIHPHHLMAHVGEA